MIRAGFSEVNITPALGFKMSGMLNPPAAGGIEWPLYARTVVFDDGVKRIAVVSLDLLSLRPHTVAEYRTAIAAGNDIEPADILIACSHTHRGPFTGMGMDEDTNFAYLDDLRAWLVQGMARAFAALQPARIKVGQTKAPGWTFNRRPVYTGEEVGTQGPAYGDNFLRLEGPADDDLQVLLVEDSQGAVLGGLVDFACHPTLMFLEPVYSADFSGALMEELAQRHGGIFAYLQGASGNLWARDLSLRAPRFPTSQDHVKAMAQALADKADEVMRSARELHDVSLRTGQEVLRIEQRRPTAEQVQLARWYLEERKSAIDEQEFTQRMYGHDYTFYHNSPEVSKWFSREAIGMWEMQRRIGSRELRDDVEIQALAIGEVGLVTFPVELFTEFGIAAKAHSPFADTFVVSIANGCLGYVPTLEAFSRGGYEPRLGGSSHLIPEAGNLMTDAALRLLRGLSRPSA